MPKSYTGPTTIEFVRAPAGPTAEHLLVTFPKLHPGGAPPKSQLYRDLAGIDAHRLALGADEYNFVGPRRELRGLHTSSRLIRREARRLGVPREHVVALGTSMGAVCSLFIGLKAGVGWIIAGGAVVRMGSQLRRLASIDGPTEAAKARADGLMALADNGDGKAAHYLDRMIARSAQRVSEPTRLDLFVSPRDPAYPDVEWLAERLEGHPYIDARITLGEYRRHNQLPDEFHPFALELLGDACGTVAADQAIQKSFSSPTENGHLTGGSASM